MKDQLSLQSGNVNSNIPLGSIDEGQQMNLSEVSISEVETIQQFPQENHYSFVRDIETPINDLLERSHALRSENLEDLIEQMTPSLPKISINQGILGDGGSMLDHGLKLQERPLSPGLFASEFRKAQARELGVSRRQALEYNSDFLEEMESHNMEVEEQKLPTIEQSKNKRDELSTPLETVSYSNTVATNPYGTSTTEMDEYHQGEIATVEHSRRVSSMNENSPFQSLQKIPPKKGEKKGVVTFDTCALYLELDGREQAKLLPYIEKAEDLVQELKDLQPGDVEGGSAVYHILKEQYSARLREQVVMIVEVMGQIYEFSAVGLQYVVRVAQIGMYVLEEKIKGELWTRVVKEYRKNVEIKNRELRKQVLEKKRQRTVLARTLRMAGSPSARYMSRMTQNSSSGGLQVNKMLRIRSEYSSLGGKRVSTSPTRYSSRTSASSSDRKKKAKQQTNGAIDSESKVRIKKKQRSRTPLRSKSSNLFSQKQLANAYSPRLLSKQGSATSTPKSASKSRSITPFQPEKKLRLGAQKPKEKENMQKNLKNAKIARSKAYAATVKEKQKKQLNNEKSKSILDDKLVTIQQAKRKDPSQNQKKVVVSYRGGSRPTKPVVMRKKQKIAVDLGDSEGGDQGWLGADLDF